MPYSTIPLELNVYLNLFCFESICDSYLTTDLLNLSWLVDFRSHWLILDQIFQFSHVSTQTEKS
jgi:hypothetical protein